MSMFQSGRREHRRPLDLDWYKLLSSQDGDEPPPTLAVKSNLTTTQPFSSSVMDSDHRRSLIEQYRRFKDFELEEQIQKRKATIEEMAFKLPDKGEKLYFGLKLLEEEKERRQLRRVAMEAVGCDKLTKSSSHVGALRNDNKQETIQSQHVPKSSFAFYLSRKIDEKTSGSTVRAFDKELSILGRSDHQETNYNRKLSPKRRHIGRSSSRQQSFKSSWGFFHHEEKNAFLKGHHKGRASSTNSLQNLNGTLSRKDNLQVQHSMDFRPGKGSIIVDLDEDEPQRIEETEDIDECIKETKIYYPSRDDPEFVEICYEDIKCLGPESYFTSNIMNFYIRYLQQHTSPTNRAIHDYHFFNTYFYQKLQNAVSYKGSDKDEFFVKFRRWWKGVDIFQKAYILIPIHQDVHWSLVIICIPDKEDESGPIILHLDSLAFHSSRSIFSEIKSFVIEEWRYSDKKMAYSNLPIADRIWKNLPRRIEDNVIVVPQQKNDYDCGLFVLYFMERFIEEAPQRLKNKDLAMFGKQWFKPEQASSLRVKIKKLLKEEFQKCPIEE